MQTFIELTNAAKARAVELRTEIGRAPGKPARSFSMAITALENAQMWFNVALDRTVEGDDYEQIDPEKDIDFRDFVGVDVDLGEPVV